MLVKYSSICAKRLQRTTLGWHSGKHSLTRVNVQVHQGVIVGREERLPNGEPYHCFQGIPYAVPPLGEYRFKSPVPLERFDIAVLDCTRERDQCHQRNPVANRVMGSENCLNLNVYAPAKRSAQPMPVMVWIHGGGFLFGTGNNSLPLSLMCGDVIVVSVNYRLGAWGFLCLPEEGVWGNAGLKDQRLALQWIHDNIANFNGDPNNVTLFGESAGAASVHLHTLADHAHKLFHRAIMQSGTANMEWAFQQYPDHKVRRLCELLGCKSRNTAEMLRFLQSPDKVATIAVLSKTMDVLLPDERRRGLPLAFRPVIEDSSSPDSFISKPILECMRQRDSLAMPTIMGYNSGEGIAMLSNAVRKIDDINYDLERFVPRNIPLPTDHKEIKAIAQKIREFYFGGHEIGHEQLDALANLLTDYHFMFDLQCAAECQVQYQPRAPLYFYRYDYTGERDLFKRSYQLEHVTGACHADELHYLFQTPGIDSTRFAEDDKLLVRRLSAMWTNFAHHGEPTPQPSAIVKELGVIWAPVKRPMNGVEFVLDCFIIDRQCRMQREPDKERKEFWQDIYRHYAPLDYSLLSGKFSNY